MGARSTEAQALCCNVSASTTWQPLLLSSLPASLAPAAAGSVGGQAGNGCYRRAHVQGTTGRLTLLTVVAELESPE